MIRILALSLVTLGCLTDLTIWNDEGGTLYLLGGLAQLFGLIAYFDFRLTRLEKEK